MNDKNSHAWDKFSIIGLCSGVSPPRWFFSHSLTCGSSFLYGTAHLFCSIIFFKDGDLGHWGWSEGTFSHLRAQFHPMDFCMIGKASFGVRYRVLVAFELPLFWNDGGRCALVTIKCSRNTFCSATRIGDNYVDYYLSFRFSLFQFAKNKPVSEGNNHPCCLWHCFTPVPPLGLSLLPASYHHWVVITLGNLCWVGSDSYSFPKQVFFYQVKFLK